MYNRKFINGLKKKYQKGGIKKYQQGSFMDQEMNAYQQLENMENDFNEWTGSMKRTDADGATIEVGPVQSSFVNEDGSLQTPMNINEPTGINIKHDKFNTYSPFTKQVQTMFSSDMSKLPDYLSTLSSEKLNSLVTDMKDNDLMGMPGITDGVYNENNTNPLYTEAVIQASLNKFESEREGMQDKISNLKIDLDNQMASLQNQDQQGMSLGDKIDMSLSTAGMTPGYGIGADVLNLASNLGQSGYDLITGDWDELGHDLTNAAWGIPALFPFLGQVTGTAKLGTNAIKLTDKGSDAVKLTDKTTDARKVVDDRLKEINNRNLPVPYKGGPPAVIVKNADDLTSGGVNFIRVTDDAYPIVKYSDEMSGVVNNPINKNAGKGLNWWGRTKATFHPTKGWKNAWKQAKDAFNSPIANWNPGNRFLNPVAGAVKHFTTPKWAIIEGAAGTILYNIIDQNYIQPAERAVFEQEEAIRFNKQQQEKIQREMPIYGPESFTDTIPTGQNVYNMLTYQGKLQDWKLQGKDGVEYYNQAKKKMDVIKWNPDITDQDALDIFLSLYPLNWGEDTDNNIIKFSAKEEKKQTGGYRRRQMGGGYMGIPQQQPVGDEGMMGQMQQFKRGGQNLPGGNVQQIPGSDAVQFNGQTHDQGGIMMDAQTEVEDGETMDKVNMAKGGGPKDYFFSSHLKKGGRSYAEHHKDILRSGGDQGSIDMLAKMQEKAAGRNPNKVNVAKTGGYVRKFQNAGPKPERNIYSNEYSDVEQIYKDLGYTDLSGGTNFKGIDHGDEGYKNTQGKNKQDGVHTGYYGDIGPAEREGFYNRNKDIMESMGVMKWQDFDPLTQTDNFQTKYNAFLTDEYNNNQDLQDQLKDKGMGDIQSYIDAVGFTNNGHGSQKIDNYFGSFTHGRSSMRGPGSTPEEEDCECEDATTAGVMHKHPCAGPIPAACAKTPKIPGKQPCSCDPKLAADDPKCCEKTTTTLNPGPLQLLPAAYAFSEGPDYMSQHPMRSPAAIIPERLAKTNLERVDMNADRARNASDARSLNKFIETSGGGSSNIVNKMAAYSKKRQADSDITDTENKTNIAISNQEAIMDQERKGKNVANALDASKFNVTSQSDANKHNSTMEATVDEFNRASDSAVKDRRLMALDSATKTVTGLYTDKLQYDAQERMAQAISGQTGVYQREQNKLAYSQQLIGQGIQPGTQQYNDAMEQYNKGQTTVMRYGGYRRRY